MPITGGGYSAGSMGDGKKSYKGKSTKPGGGGRFSKLVDKLKGEGKSEDAAKGIAAAAGRAKYGASKMQKWSASGRKRSG